MTAVASMRAPARVEAMPRRTAVIRRVVRETPDTATYWMTFRDPLHRATYHHRPGQINMVYLFGIGEVPLSVSSDPGRPTRIAHTVRSTGRVTDAFRLLRPGDQVGIRGPFGRPWPVGEAEEGDLLIVAGGLGMAPLRPVIYEALRQRQIFRRLILLVGARSPEHMLYRQEMDLWMHWLRFRGMEVHLTVDIPDDTWPYGEGVVTTLFEPARLDPEQTTAFVCGPEIMMRFAIRGLRDLGIKRRSLWVSMERNMQCGVQSCGHCQLGPKFVCTDGPVFRYDEVASLMEVDEL
jgi:NAD(P)H-flavin reductase